MFSANSADTDNLAEAAGCGSITHGAVGGCAGPPSDGDGGGAGILQIGAPRQGLCLNARQ